MECSRADFLLEQGNKPHTMGVFFRYREGMFTGIVEEIGRVLEVRPATNKPAAPSSSDIIVTIAAARIMEDIHLGDSLACGGCCLTVSRIHEGSFEVELSRESINKTAPRWQVGSTLNLERAMKADGRFGGHMVSGHVEGVGEVVTKDSQPGAYTLTVKAPENLGRYLVPKGSITVDGVSLTVVDVGGAGGTRSDWDASMFSLWLIPHTLEVTTLGELDVGSQVNLEADLVAKYLERLSQPLQAHSLQAHSLQATSATSL